MQLYLYVRNISVHMYASRCMLSSLVRIAMGHVFEPDCWQYLRYTYLNYVLACLLAHLFTYLPTCLPTYLPAYLPTCLATHRHTYLAFPNLTWLNRSAYSPNLLTSLPTLPQLTKPHLSACSLGCLQTYPPTRPPTHPLVTVVEGVLVICALSRWGLAFT